MGINVNTITFNGIVSLDKGLYVSGDHAFNSAEKDYDKVSVPGRSGDLLVFNNRYKNVDVVYHGIVIGNYASNTAAIREWLLSSSGYCRLEDTYNPDYFRMASFSGPVEFDTKMLVAGETDLTFDSKPERWLKVGETSINYTANGAISNPTSFSAKPLLRVYGTGTFQVGTGTIVINTSGTSYIDIDCSIFDCFEGSVNRNSNVTIQKWPELVSGTNGIVLGAGITKITVTPRWWTL